MTRLFLHLALSTVLLAQAPQPAPEKELASIDGLMRALYATLSGPKGQPRDVSRYKAFFVPGARITARRLRKDGRPGLVVMDLDDFASKSLGWMEAHGFYERELGRKVEQWGGVAQVWSSYSSGSTPDLPASLGRGINALSLVNDGQRWWIAGVSVGEESEGNPLPALPTLTR